MVICVEPFGHLSCGHAFTVVRVSVRAAFLPHLALRTPSHGEICLETHLAARPAVNGWDSAHHYGRIEHMVIEREVIGRDDAGAEVPLTRPRFAS